MKSHSESEHFETNAIRTQSDNASHKEHSTPIFMTSSFVFDDAENARAMFADEISGNIYSRFSNPNSNELVEKLCLLEGGDDGIATASGMAAMYSSMAGLLQQGDHVLASRSLFGSTHQVLTQIFPKWGISHSYADIHDPESWESLINEKTKLIFVETPSNPGLDLVDLEWLGNLAKKHNLILIVDNCFATPYLQQPLKYGAHLICHSTTKFIDGQGRTVGGAIIGDKELIQKIRFFCRHTGPAMSPFNAWVLSKSLETLAVRMDRHCQSALAIAGQLEKHPEINFVKYPFLPSHPQYELAKKQMLHGGGLFTFEVKGGVERGRKFLDNLQMLSLTANLGDTRTIATHPASTTHSKLSDQERANVGITPGLVRISVGLEHPEDIIRDIENALKLSES
ncbi:trans-sulfuration enzyme family protein [Fulvivirga sedimenti]|uniref:O-succinylhomoserine sulfhydrylase n=1 Tax=Fulvivirga sedimenti TaxID=2879465 RepID=A0A9X1KZQ1_9BACT|nr:aminotransferase class I/II-fold pyridoxal phosphate-dependent enzyme [Fulvivirga sedimenti]MCA6075250.1 aminotransferase class I/II-fold pyridoxal phosphate-dependent enzyme [Fulvivirga sedimenti]MCA6076427.1 aminotransferase class I/II-fold pyridoxal phosphate-dependent enzyme [Fulvivirga sedimenti]MCA6077555.1 aminotransferase class I/II-fold pyridoxal phosphate-dependent enzyme [Fulvivirga sedimenti]